MSLRCAVIVMRVFLQVISGELGAVGYEALRSTNGRGQGSSCRILCWLRAEANCTRRAQARPHRTRLVGRSRRAEESWNLEEQEA